MMKLRSYKRYWIGAIALGLLLGLVGLGWNLYVTYTTPVTPYVTEAGDFDLHIPAVGHRSTTLDIEWSPADTADAKVYDVYVDGDLLEHLAPHGEGDTVSPRIRLEGLTPDTVYMVQVKGLNLQGQVVSVSSKVPMKTLPKEPKIEATAYGAIGVGVTDNTLALQMAIRDTPAGGILHLSKGVYRTGALFLHSYMTLELEEGAVLEAVDDSIAFLRPNYVATGGTSYLGVLNIEGDGSVPAERVIVRGGTIDGHGWNTRLLTDKELSEEEVVDPEELEEKGVLSQLEVQSAMRRGASYDKGLSTRSSLVSIHHGKDIVLENVVLRNAPAHMVKATQVQQFYVQDVKMEGMFSGDGLHWDGVGLYMQGLAMEYMQQGIVVLAGNPVGSSVTEQWHGSDIQIRHSRIGIVFSNTGNTWIQHIFLQGLRMEGVDLAMRVRETTTIGGGIRDIIVTQSQLRDVLQHIDVGGKRNNPVDWTYGI